MIESNSKKKKNVEEVAAALRPTHYVLSSCIWDQPLIESAKCRTINEEDTGDDETNRLVMSLRGCLLDLFLLVLIWVMSLSRDVQESRGLIIIEGETFSLLSF